MPNPIFWAVLIGRTAFFLLDSIAALLGLRSLRFHAQNPASIPSVLASLCDAEQWRRLERYTSANTKAHLVESTLDFALLLAFWFSGGFAFLNDLIARRHLGIVPGGVLFIAILWAAKWLISLPFEIHHTFSIEQKFGLNRTTPKTFAADHLKSLLLTAILGGPILAAVLALLEHAGPRAWLYAWILISCVSFLFAWLAPVVLMPLFNKFTPLDPGALKDAIVAYARANAFPIRDVFVMDGSRRSTRANAFFTGFGKTRKVVLFDTLIREHTQPELVAVLAHEIGHYKLRHIILRLATGLLNAGLFLFLASVLIHSPALAAAFGITTTPVHGSFALFLITVTPLLHIESILSTFQSRRHEYAADRFAVRTTGSTAPLIDALKRLSSSNLSNLVPHPLQVFLHYSHPPLAQRVSAIQKAGIAAIQSALN